jgi:glycosyltransferase involved in cell wall biosynthesis
MPSNNLVSVIVPCYNYAHFLGEALNSVLAQTYSNWECIIINDGSPDNTEEVALEYCEKDSRFKYFYKENGGHSSARNYGIAQSKGKYIMPLDADDILELNYLEEAVIKIESDENIKLVTAQVQHFGDVNEKFIMPAYSLRSYLIVNYISISSLFKKEAFYNANGFDESMLVFEDWDLFIKILKDGGEAVELPFVGLNYRRKDESLFRQALKENKRSFKDLLKLYMNNIDVYEKYFDSPVVLIQENEKMKRVISNYQKSRTYKLGTAIKNVKSIFKSFK